MAEQIRMVQEINIRPSREMRQLIDYIRSRCLLYGIKCPSITKITEVIAKTIDREKLWQNEFVKK